MSRINRKLAALCVAALPFAGAALLDAAPAMARTHHVVSTTGWTALAPRQEPAAGTNSLAAFSRGVEGTPCGITCTQDQEMQQNIGLHQ